LRRCTAAERLLIAGEAVGSFAARFGSQLLVAMMEESKLRSRLFGDRVEAHPLVAGVIKEIDHHAGFVL